MTDKEQKAAAKKFAAERQGLRKRTVTIVLE